MTLYDLIGSGGESDTLVAVSWLPRLRSLSNSGRMMRCSIHNVETDQPLVNVLATRLAAGAGPAGADEFLNHGSVLAFPSRTRTLQGSFPR